MGILLAIVYEAMLPIWIIAIMFGGLIALLIGLASSPDERTRRIVILGSSMSGKTTLWNQLKNRKIGYDYIPTPGQTVIDSFKVKYKDHEVRVLATKDIGGSDAWVKYYNELITEDGTFIYFLVDLTRLQDAKQEIRSRLQLISKCIKDKKLNDCGFKIIATHFDEYDKNNYNLLEKTKKAKAEVISVLTDKEIKNCSLKIDLDHIMVANLLDKSYINSIKKEIAQE